MASTGCTVGLDQSEAYWMKYTFALQKKPKLTLVIINQYSTYLSNP